MDIPFCEPENHVFIWDGKDLDRTQEPPTDTICVCGEKKWIRSGIIGVRGQADFI